MEDYGINNNNDGFENGNMYNNANPEKNIDTNNVLESNVEINAQVNTQVNTGANSGYGNAANNDAANSNVNNGSTYNGNSSYYTVPYTVQGNNPASVYYKENYKKTKERGRKTNLFQLILVSIMSAILGGGVVFAAIQFVAPVIQPAVGGILNENGIKTQTAANSGSDNGIYKKVEITKSDSAVSAIYDKLSPSIVGIKVTAAAQDFFLGQSESTGEGSGIIIREDGYILTNYHVIEGAVSTRTNTLTQGAKIEVILPEDKNKSYTATVIGKDSKSDLAVLKIDAGKKLQAAELGDSDNLKQGELAVAIGNPGGLDYMGSVTAGVISGLNRTITTEDGKTLTLIQTDAAINPGNSGGALANSQGQVIGVNTIKISANGFEGLGFAIPINHAKEVANNLIEYKYIKGRPLIGVEIRSEIDKATAQQYGVPEGVLVGNVTPFGAAERAGIQSNDIITKFDGQVVTTYAKLEELKNKHKPGDKVTVEIYRYEDKSTKTLTLTLDEDKS